MVKHLRPLIVMMLLNHWRNCMNSFANVSLHYWKLAKTFVNLKLLLICIFIISWVTSATCHRLKYIYIYIITNRYVGTTLFEEINLLAKASGTQFVVTDATLNFDDDDAAFRWKRYLLLWFITAVPLRGIDMFAVHFTIYME